MKRKKKNERCQICGNYLLHKRTIERLICKKCEPDLSIKFALKKYKSNNILLEYKLL